MERSSSFIRLSFCPVSLFVVKLDSLENMTLDYCFCTSKIWFLHQRKLSLRWCSLSGKHATSFSLIYYSGLWRYYYTTEAHIIYSPRNVSFRYASTGSVGKIWDCLTWFSIYVPFGHRANMLMLLRKDSLIKSAAYFHAALSNSKIFMNCSRLCTQYGVSRTNIFLRSLTFLPNITSTAILKAVSCSAFSHKLKLILRN